MTPVTFRHAIAPALAAAEDDQAAASQLGRARVPVTARHYIKDGVGVREGNATITAHLGENTTE